MKNAIFIFDVLGELMSWGKPSIEINEVGKIDLHVEGMVDRFSVTVYPNGKTYLNVKSFERCTEGDVKNFKDRLNSLFNTTCYDIDESNNQFMTL